MNAAARRLGGKINHGSAGQEETCDEQDLRNERGCREDSENVTKTKQDDGSETVHRSSRLNFSLSIFVALILFSKKNTFGVQSSPIRSKSEGLGGLLDVPAMSAVTSNS